MGDENQEDGRRFGSNRQDKVVLSRSHLRAGNVSPGILYDGLTDLIEDYRLPDSTADGKANWDAKGSMEELLPANTIQNPETASPQGIPIIHNGVVLGRYHKEEPPTTTKTNA